jgi:hypothetical protein
MRAGRLSHRIVSRPVLIGFMTASTRCSEVKRVPMERHHQRQR